MCRQHPDLPFAEAHAAMACDFDHHGEIDEEIEAELAIVREDRLVGGESPVILRLRAGRFLIGHSPLGKIQVSL
jgi:hypothetical protein